MQGHKLLLISPQHEISKSVRIWRLMCVLNPSERRKVQLSTEVELELLLTTSNISPRAPIMLKGFWADDQAVIFQVVFAIIVSST